MAEVYVGLGSNRGDREAHLSRAGTLLASTPGIVVRQASSCYETEPWGVAGQADYWNQVLALECGLAPEMLLTRCLDIERRMGRVRLERWGPRIIDIDILLFEARICQDARLTIPHPYMKQRLFVLTPLQEIAPGLVFPDDGQTIEEVVILARKTHPIRITKR
jgi:2-amino-4-hydroxy-6-hydroxymethyldihydropteridine diphosphokinase